MGLEIERKYLLCSEAWRELGPGLVIVQGYLSTTRDCAVRVRIIGDTAFLGIKGKTSGMTRQEFEYSIPVQDAQEMLESLAERPFIEKTRYTIPYGGLIWEIDEFHGENQGLIIAEVELTAENQQINIPEWIGSEVTNDPRYYNANLVAHPYSHW